MVAGGQTDRRQIEENHNVTVRPAGPYPQYPHLIPSLELGNESQKRKESPVRSETGTV